MNWSCIVLPVTLPALIGLIAAPVPASADYKEAYGNASYDTLPAYVEFFSTDLPGH